MSLKIQSLDATKNRFNPHQFCLSLENMERSRQNNLSVVEVTSTYHCEKEFDQMCT